MQEESWLPAERVGAAARVEQLEGPMFEQLDHGASTVVSPSLQKAVSTRPALSPGDST